MRDSGEGCHSQHLARTTPSPVEYLYQMMKFNKFSLPLEVGGGRGPIRSHVQYS